MILSDKTIRRNCVKTEWWDKDYKAIIEPFVEETKGNDIISYGLSSSGYDMRLGNEVWVFKNTFGEVVNPKKFKADPDYARKLFDIRTEPDHTEIIIPGNGYILGTSVEYFRMPPYLMGIVLGKSTYARCGLIVNCTPLEPGWEGNLTIEISNSNPAPASVFVGEGVAQLLLFLLDQVPEKNYKDKGGKYQSQIGVTAAKVL